MLGAATSRDCCSLPSVSQPQLLVYWPLILPAACEDAAAVAVVFLLLVAVRVPAAGFMVALLVPPVVLLADATVWPGATGTTMLGLRATTGAGTLTFFTTAGGGGEGGWGAGVKLGLPT